jgi:hypothetical protein
VAVRNLPEPLRTGDIYFKGELGTLLHSTSFSDKVLHLGIKSILLAKLAEALTRQGQVKIATASLAGSVFVEDKQNARSRDVILLYSGALFATGIAIGTDGIIELIRFAGRRPGRRIADRAPHGRHALRRNRLEGRDADAGHDGA